MSASTPNPDLIVVARRCRTFCEHPATVESIAVAQGRIIALGTRRRMLKLRHRATRVLSLGNATVTPGLVDCHTHFFYWAMFRALIIDVATLPSLDSVLRKIRAQSRTKRVGEWVVANGFDHNRWGTGLPNARDLDRAVTGSPALVRSRDGHSAWLNSVGLRRAGINRHTLDPKGGGYLRDAHGQPTGIVLETAVDNLPDPMREFALRNDASTRAVVDRTLRAAYRYAWMHGLVGVHSMDDGVSLGHFARHRHEGKLGLRILHAVPLGDFEHARRLGLRSGFGDEWLRIGGVKMFADGALGSQTAHMFDPYPGRGDYRGVPVLTGPELEEAVRSVARNGWAAWIHAIGDRAVHEVVRAIGLARRLGTAPMPHRIEHAQCVRPTDVRRMGQAGVVASVQPCHLLGDIATADRHWPRARRDAYPFRRLLSANVVLAAGSDAPIEDLDPRRSLFGATMRTDERGAPAGGWYPEQCVSTDEVLRAFTQGAAIAAGAQDGAGTLAIGAPADLTIWREDPLRAAPQTLLNIEIAGCVVGGQPHLASEA